eukprot:COSAG01_NODE_674_length_14337_cov_14.996418_1_plen_188_part_00
MVEMGIHGLASYVAERYDAVRICSLLRAGACCSTPEILACCNAATSKLSGPSQLPSARHALRACAILPCCGASNNWAVATLAAQVDHPPVALPPGSRLLIDATGWAFYLQECLVLPPAPSVEQDHLGDYECACHSPTHCGRACARSDHHPSGGVLLERWTRLHAAPSPRCGTRVCSLFSTSTGRCAG